MRIKWIDSLRGIAIVLVVIGHAIMRYDCAILHIVIYSFHMPLFFWISGYIFTMSDARIKLKKIVKHLLVPYVFFGICGFCYNIIVHEFIIHDLEYFLESRLTFSSISETIFYGNESLFSEYWFFPVLFITTTVFVLFSILIKSDLRLILIINVISFTFYFVHIYHNIEFPIGICQAFLGLVFFSLGFFMKKYGIVERIDNRICILSFLIFLIGNYLTISFGYGSSYMHLPNVNNYLVFYIIAVSAIVCLSAFFEKYNNKSGIMSFWGQNSLYIYGMHYVILDIVFIITQKIFSRYMITSNYLALLILVIFTLFICSILCTCINKVRNLVGLDGR